MAASAGESVKALKAEMSTEIATVTANCLFNCPWIPLMKAMGMNTDARIRAMATTGPETSRMACSVASRGAHSLFDMVLHRLDDDDRIVHHQADRQHKAKQRKRIDRKSERREKCEGADQRYRHCDHGNQRRAPILQEHIDDQDHQPHRDQQRHHDFVDALGYRQRGIECRC